MAPVSIAFNTTKVRDSEPTRPEEIKSFSFRLLIQNEMYLYFLGELFLAVLFNVMVVAGEYLIVTTEQHENIKVLLLLQQSD